MTYGWYLLGETQKELIRSHVVRDILPYGPFHVDVRFDAQACTKPDAFRFREVLDELAAMNLIGVSIDVSTTATIDTTSDLTELLRDIVATGAVITCVDIAAAILSPDLAHALLEAEAHSATLRFDATGERVDDESIDNVRYLRDERNRRGWHVPKIICRYDVDPPTGPGPDDLIALGRELQAGLVRFEFASTRVNTEAQSQDSWFSAIEADAASGFVRGPFTESRDDVATGATAVGALSMTTFLPWFHCVIDANLDVWPCRHAAHTSRPLGNLRRQTVSEVWNGERFRAHRRSAAIAAGALAGEVADSFRQCRACEQSIGYRDDAFLAETETWIARMRASMSAPYFPKVASDDGFAHPALRALRLRFPRSKFAAGKLDTVERIHAEAEIARIEALRLRVRAAELESDATMLLRTSPTVADPELARRSASDLKRQVAELDAFAERLFEEAGRVGSVELVSAAPPPFVSMRKWLERLAEVDSSVSTEVDETRVIWMSLFKTLAENADMSKIQRVMGVGVGFDGPEVNYNDHFADHYCLDIVDYSDRNPKLKFVTANIETGVDFPDAHFDLIYSHSVFEHLKDVGAALREVDRLVALGKYIYITISPLYYSRAGAHVNHPVKLDQWEHLDPASRYYLLDSPDPSRIDEGVYLNKVTVSEFLAEVGKVGWEIRHFSMRIVHPRDIPVELTERFPMVDLAVEEFRFVGRKVIPKAKGIEW